MAALVLKPLIEVLIRNGFTHAELTEIVRQSYVDVAYEECAATGHKLTYSRVAALTGLCRKEVVRLRNKLKTNNQWEYLHSNESAQIIDGWLRDKDYGDSANNPIDLPVSGKSPSFESLVNKYSGAIAYKNLLSELCKAGITSQFSGGTVRLMRTQYASQQLELEQVQLMSVCATDLFSVALDKEKASNNDIRFNWQLVYSGIEDKLAKQFHELGNDKAMAFFNTLTEFLSNDENDSDPGLTGRGKRVGLGIYYFDGAKITKSVKMTSEDHA